MTYHPLPAWYDEAKLGIFVHWGVSSVPAYAPASEGFAQRVLKGEIGFGSSPYAEWYQNSLRIPGSPVRLHHDAAYGADFGYERFGPLFNEQMRKWDPDSWAGLFARAGARYAVLVAKHHDGFLMWNSSRPNPRIPGWMASRDVPGELSRALGARGIRLGLYYSSLLDWSFSTSPVTSLAELVAGSDASREYASYVEDHWLELIERYDPWILWSDIGCPPGFRTAGLFARYYNRKPEGVVNDRWMQLPRFFFNRTGRFILAKLLGRMKGAEPPRPAHCDFVTPEYAALDHIGPRKWETCRGIGNSFGYNRMEAAGDYLKADELVRLLADIVSKNGNLLLNVGPCPDGSIHPSQVEALEGMGSWLRDNGEAIYGTRPWVRFSDSAEGGTELRYTSKGGALYAIVTRMPANGLVPLPREAGAAAAAAGGLTLLGTGERLRVEGAAGKTLAVLPHGLREGSIPTIKIAGAVSR
jgi:alpha-L-fucosidase